METLADALADAKVNAMHYQRRMYVLCSHGRYYVHIESSAMCSRHLIVAKALASGTTIVLSHQGIGA